ncbi:hypothetical protein Moror_4013 [Moniliophthora roreri MCA 2997]|uniref:Uncharacterized protein n=1 Tax=Moniliophthora roreri (strain MCA 2997) TaxID=1381753 RepID=V2XRU5_MONRO|nr:hypothetical protein Moror_4013 [Moniliophthora roreri MCA 2997]
MSSDHENSLKALMPVILIFVGLTTACLFWCFLSSCLGLSLRRLVSTWWEYAELGATSNQRRFIGRRGGIAEDEMWEMDMQARRGY